jgi:hypothetical protein
VPEAEAERAGVRGSTPTPHDYLCEYSIRTEAWNPVGLVSHPFDGRLIARFLGLTSHIYKLGKFIILTVWFHHYLD